jgi:hypothetical protein
MSLRKRLEFTGADSSRGSSRKNHHAKIHGRFQLYCYDFSGINTVLHLPLLRQGNFRVNPRKFMMSNPSAPTFSNICLFVNLCLANFRLDEFRVNHAKFCHAKITFTRCRAAAFSRVLLPRFRADARQARPCTSSCGARTRDTWAVNFPWFTQNSSSKAAAAISRGQSYLTADSGEVQGLVDQFAGTGKFEKSKKTGRR